MAGLGLAGYAYASGWPPFAFPDSASVGARGSVSILDGGRTSVLANDFDLERDPLTASLTRGPEKGTVQLNADGTFLYRHTGENEQGFDEFYYRAFDGTSFSREARVQIEIKRVPNNPPVVTGQPPPQEVVADTRYRLDLSRFFSDPDESDDLRFTADGLPGSGRLRMDPDTGVLSGTPLDRDARDRPYNVRVTATDRRGATATLSFELTILEVLRPDLLVTGAVETNPVTIGETARWVISIENIGPGALEDGELQAQWLGSGTSLSLVAPDGCTIEGNASRNPFVRCVLPNLGAGDAEGIPIEVTQGVDGDYSLVAVAIADDPVPENNAFVGGGQVVARFSEGPAQVVSVEADTVAGGDLNGDGRFDVVAPSPDGTIIYFNDGGRSLGTPGVSIGDGSGGAAAVVLDWNFDGQADIAVGGVENAAARVYLNAGNGNFDESVDIRISGLGQVLAVGGGDLNGDGNDDLVLAGSGDSVLVLSDGGSGFSEVALPGQGSVDLAITDLDSDGDEDIVLVAAADRTVVLLFNAGDGLSFEQDSLVRGSVSGVSANDLNRDGRVDLLLAVDGADLEPPESRILIQEIDGTFPEGERIGASPLSKLIAGDVDGDELVDIIAINDGGVHQLYRGTVDGSFALSPEQIISEGVRRALLVDVTNDEALDLVLAGRRAGVVEVHANNGIGKLGLGDRIAPEIRLNGESSLTLASGQKYVEAGASAMDDIDGDISAQITISGSVNTTVVGTYTLTYTARDRAGNSASTTRKVQVGVNEGTGGAGGGAISPYFFLVLIAAAAVRRRYRQV